MIVMTTEEKDWLLNFLEEFKANMLADGLAVIPVEFIGGWMLPESVLNDPRCSRAKQKLIDIGEYKNITFREVLPEELIVPMIEPVVDPILMTSQRKPSGPEEVLEVDSTEEVKVIATEIKPEVTIKPSRWERFKAWVKKIYRKLFK